MTDTLHLVDSALRPMLDMWPTVALGDDNLAELREKERTLPLPPVAPNDVALEERRIPGPAGAPDITLLIYTPRGPGPFPCLYHVHGGGYVGGAAAPLEFMHRPLAQELGCVIASVDYRLAPETSFPGNVEDCYAGLAWVAAHAAELRVDPRRIGVTGESAGGGLAAALALIARDRGEVVLAFQLLTYPMLDDRTGTSSDPHPHVGEFIWTPHNNRFGWRALLGHEPGGEDVSPYAAAARAPDLSGLPPTFIMTGALDLFLEEDLEYARRLMRAGVPTELHVYPGAFHGFDIMPGDGVAESARMDRVNALRRFMAASG